MQARQPASEKKEKQKQARKLRRSERSAFIGKVCCAICNRRLALSLCTGAVRGGKALDRQFCAGGANGFRFRML
jgi:hypothetical protein